MIDFRKLCVLAVFAILPTVGLESGLAQDVDGDFLKIESNAEAEALLKERRYVQAEEKARELNLDVRIVATICAYAKKKDEAFQLFMDYINALPEEHKEQAALQAVNLLRGASSEFADEFFEKTTEQEIITLSEDELLCREVETLLRKDAYEEAGTKLNLLLDSSYAGEDLVDAAILFLALSAQSEEETGELCKKLLVKFPDNPRVKFQSIVSSVPTHSKAVTDADARQLKTALAELEQLKTSSPDFYKDNELTIRVTRGRIFEHLGDVEQSKAEFEALLNTEYDATAKDKLHAFETKERLAQEWKQINEPKPKEAKTESSNQSCFRTSVVFNLILASIVLFMLYQRHRKATRAERRN